MMDGSGSACNAPPTLTATGWCPALADPSVPTQILTYKMRLLPRKAQHARLRAALDHARDLYNAALAERIDCYRRTGRGRSWQDQFKGLTELRADPAWATYPVTLQRWPLKQVDLAFAAFFRCVKANKVKAGFPRFKGRDWFKTFGFSDRNGWSVTDKRLRMKGIGCIRLHVHRPLPNEPIACKVKRQGRHWYALLTIEAPCAIEHAGAAIGIDMGISTLAALSTGELIANMRPSGRAKRKMRVAQRALARCKRGSKNRRKIKAHLTGLHGDIARKRDAYLHQVSASLTRRFGVIAIEKLNIKGLAGGILAKEVHDVAWGRLIQMLRYKAAKAGGKLIEVDPRYTSQTCPDCGVIEKKELSERIHRCACGCILDRDVAAARVILHKAGIGLGLDNVAQWGERRAGKICEAA